METIYVTYKDEKQIEKLGDVSKYSPSFYFIDVLTNKGKKEAFRLKSHYAARLDPFSVVLSDGKPIKAFYSEAEDVIESLLKYLNDGKNC